MPEIKNMGGVTAKALERELNNGARFVMFQYTISIIVLTFKRSSDIYFVPADESPAKYGWMYTVLSFLFGWWGIPWGPIYTIGSIAKNLQGGTDVTAEVVAQMTAGFQEAE